MKNLRLTPILVALFALTCAAWLPAAENALEQGFRNVPNADRPWVYWWWLNGNVDQHTITRDLEAMRQDAAVRHARGPPIRPTNER